MTAQAKEIVTMFEVCDMTVEQIAQEVGLEEVAVRAVLTVNSPKFKDSDQNLVEDISDDEFAQIKAAYKQLMFSEDEKVRERALRFMWNEKKGRNEEKQIIQNVGKMNILVFNDRLLKAREAKKKFLNSPSNTSNEEVIEVESTKEEVAA